MSGARCVFAAVTLLSCGIFVPVALADDGACTVTEARADLRKAERRLDKAEERVRDAKRVLSATRQFTSLYGSRVGRWVRLCRVSGFSWPNIPICMKVINRESRGDPNAFSGYYAGLWQMGPAWWRGRFDPYDPKKQTRVAARSVDAVGWVHWPTAWGRGY